MISGSGTFQILLIALTKRYIHWQVYSVRHRLQRGICCLLYGIRIEIDNSSKSVPSAFCLLSNGFKWTIRIYNFLKSGFYNINVNAVCFFKCGLCPAVYIDKAMRQFFELFRYNSADTECFTRYCDYFGILFLIRAI